MSKIIHTNGASLGDSAGLLIGLLLGGLAGYGAMLLFAPQSGQKTRSQIWQKSTELQGRATDTYDDLVTMSRFDQRRILIEVRTDPEKR